VGGVAGAFLLPAGELAGAAGAAAEGAEGLGALARAANPVRGAAELGQAVTKGAAPLAEGAAGLVFNPETSPIAHKILSQAGAHALGSGVEGAAYGLGQAVSEDALGEPGTFGEKVVSNVGLGALYGGAIGSAIGGVMAPFAKDSAQALQAELHGPGAAAGEFDSAVKASGLSGEEKQAVSEGLTKLKPNASEIQGAADRLGAPLQPYQLSDSKAVQNAGDMLLNGPPTISSLSHQTVAKQGFDIANSVVEKAVGVGEDLSETQIGNQLKQSLMSKLEAENAPISEMYGALKDYTQAIPVTERSTGSIAKNVLKIIDEESLIKGTPAHNFVQTISEGLEQVKNLDQLKNFRTAMRKAAGPETRYVVGAISEKLDNLEMNAIRRFADTMRTPEAKDKILGLIRQVDDAKSAYRDFRGKLQELGNGIGKKKIYGPQDFIDFIDGMNPQTLTKRLFNKGNTEFVQYFAKNFPEEMEAMKKYQLGVIRDEAMKKGYFDPKAIFKKISDLEPETRDILFSKEQLAKIKDAETYIGSFPKDFNPSHASHADAFRHAFERGPTGAIIANARDAALDQFIKHAVKIDPATGANVAKLAKLEQMAMRTTQSIQAGSKAIFKAGATASVPIALGAGKLSGHIDSEKKFKEVSAKLNELNTNPDHFIDVIDKSTSAVADVAPNVTSAMQMTATRATQFLASKLPPSPPKRPLSPDFKPSRSDVMKFNRYLSVVEQPTMVLDQVKHGTITPESIETLSVVYPKLFDEMKTAVLDELTNHTSKKKKVPYKTRLGLSMFLGQNLDNSLDQPTVQANQQMLSSQSAPAQQTAQSGPVKTTQKGISSISTPDRTLTAMQANAQRSDA
jgi:hypothetical protein